MPKVVDHEQRRRDIAGAVCRIAAAEGLEAVSVRRVAAEVGLSAPLVQLTFPEKSGMLLFAITEISEVAARTADRRVREAVEREPAQPIPTMFRALLAEALPLDEGRRTWLLVHQAYFSRALRDPEVSSIYRDRTPVLTAWLVTELRREQREGRVPAGLDPQLEAETLVALALELGTEMLTGLRDEASAMALIDYHLRRVFPANQPH